MCVYFRFIFFVFPGIFSTNTGCCKRAWRKHHRTSRSSPWAVRARLPGFISQLCSLLAGSVRLAAPIRNPQSGGQPLRCPPTRRPPAIHFLVVTSLCNPVAQVWAGLTNPLLKKCISELMRCHHY